MNSKLDKKLKAEDFEGVISTSVLLQTCAGEDRRFSDTDKVVSFGAKTQGLEAEIYGALDNGNNFVASIEGTELTGMAVSVRWTDELVLPLAELLERRLIFWDFQALLVDVIRSLNDRILERGKHSIEFVTLTRQLLRSKCGVRDPVDPSRFHEENNEQGDSGPLPNLQFVDIRKNSEEWKALASVALGTTTPEQEEKLKELQSEVKEQSGPPRNVL
jgi:hypothetical protein